MKTTKKPGLLWVGFSEGKLKKKLRSASFFVVLQQNCKFFANFLLVKAKIRLIFTNKSCTIFIKCKNHQKTAAKSALP